MKTIINTLKAIILLASIITLSYGEGMASKPQPTNKLQRYGAVGFSIGAKGYIGTGLGNTYSTTLRKDFWEYDPATDSWTQKADFGGIERYFAVGFSIGTKGYIGTGFGSNNSTGNFFNDFWEYSPSLNTWTQKAPFGGIGRGLATGFSIGSKGYIGTGRGFPGEILTNLSDFWEYDPPTNSWTRKTDFTGDARYAAVGFALGVKGYIGTGINYVNSTTFTWYKDFYEYNPGTDTWTRKADFGGTARGFAAGFSIYSTKGYIGTGNSIEGFKTDFWEYDPTNSETGGTWTKKADFPGTKRDGATGFSISTKGYLGTGLIATDTYVQDFWEYNQGTNVWTQKTDFGCKHTGKPLKDELVIGGTDQSANTALIVYPNPSNSVFNFRLKSTSEELVTIQIFDMVGRLVYEYDKLSPNDVVTVGENLKYGVYTAVVAQGEYRKNVKIIKVN